MRKRADRRRFLTFAAAAFVVVAAGTAGAFAGGLISPATPKSKATPRSRPAAAASVRNGVQRAAASSAKATARAGRGRPVRHHPAAAAASPKLYATSTIHLCAKEGSVQMPDGVTVPIWGFALLGAAPSCDDPSVVAQLPGPELDVNVGDVVTLNVTNALTGRSISLEAPGLDFGASVTDAAPGETASVTFAAGSEGTYLYESSGDAGRQTAMGLYGALVVHGPAGTADGNAVDVERTLVLSEVDANFSANPDGFNMNDWHPTYWLINGKAYPQTAPIGVPAGQRLLLRYVNAGVDNNTMTMLGLHARLLARDGYALTNPFDVVAETFPSGETVDALITIPTGAPSGTKFALYNRNLQLQNGTSDGPGGMLTFIQVP